MDEVDNRTNVIVTICVNTGFSQALSASGMQFHNIGPSSFRCWLAAVSRLWPSLATLFRHGWRDAGSNVGELQFDDFANIGNNISPLLARRRIRCCSLQFAVRCWLAAVPMLVSCSFPTPGRRWKHYSAIVGPTQVPMSARCRMPMLAERWTLVQNRIAPTLAAALGRG